MLLDTERLAVGWWRAALGATLLSGACAGTDERLLPGSPWLPASGPSATDAALPDEQDGGADAAFEAAAPEDSGADASTDAAPAVVTAVVTVDLTTPRRTVPPHAFGLHASVYDNGLHAPALPALLDQAGVTLLRWPGGGYADNYHWSTHSVTPWFGDPSKGGYLAAGSDFGSFVSLLGSFGGTAMITVNYGSNLGGTGPGEPKEAAAWVAYANGDPADTSPIGIDSVGHDWHTVGYWAGLRAAEKLGTNDGRNFLRIAHPEPLGIEYWEIGNEVFGNGYYGSLYEEDLHVPFDGTARANHPALSGIAYGQGVNAFLATMKAVDPTIKVGAVLNTPPTDYSWGPTWNSDVLAECGPNVDFVIVHWYTSRSAASLLRAPERRIPEMAAELASTIATLCAPHAERVEIALTELGPNFQVPAAQTQAAGIFAADAYLTLFEHGFVNVDWLELHDRNGSFLGEFDQARGPAFHGLRMAHLLASPGDALIGATSSESVIRAHAAERADGSVALMLVNTQSAATTTVSVAISGVSLESEATRYDYLPVGSANGTISSPTPLGGAGNQFTLELGPYAVADLILRRAVTGYATLPWDASPVARATP
jgi:hypothetical protein